ncbi:MAG: chemotaxis protein CheR [Candidatus Schekmanbacteria bacterium]|nr:MAG: chemotaxis protein CheR [Candidatus Schekmanbacteria bacterium]
MEKPKIKKFEFGKIAQTIKQISGINLSAEKESMIRSRLLKRIRALNFKSLNEYLNYYNNDKSGREIYEIIDLLTTNKTNFFREKHHFEFIKEVVIPEIKHRQYFIWSAGCSSGEEPYSIAMLLHSILPESYLSNVKILATDISTRMIHKAQEGIYDKESIKELPEYYLEQYFKPIKSKHGTKYILKNIIKESVVFAKLNLMDPWPMKGPFDLILCRNVMIYFDKETRERLINRFLEMLKENGYLFVGHSENLAGIKTSLEYIEPAIYQKPATERRKKAKL